MLRQYFFIIKQLNFKESKRKTDGTNLGFVWNVLNPFIYMVILSTYYSNIVKHENISNFPIFVFTGITMFSFYSNGTKGAMRSLVTNKALLLKVNVKKDIFIYQKVLVSFRELIFSLLALIPILMFFNIKFSYRNFEIIPILFFTIMNVIGMGKILAVIFVYFADIDYLYSVFMTLMVFVSGTIFPITGMPTMLHRVLTYNPIFLSIYLMRNSLVYDLQSHWTAWGKLIIWSLLLTIAGKYVFDKSESSIVGKL